MLRISKKSQRPPRFVGSGLPLWLVRLNDEREQYTRTHTNERGEIIIEINE